MPPLFFRRDPMRACRIHRRASSPLPPLPRASNPVRPIYSTRRCRRNLSPHQLPFIFSPSSPRVLTSPMRPLQTSSFPLASLAVRCSHPRPSPVTRLQLPHEAFPLQYSRSFPLLTYPVGSGHSHSLAAIPYRSAVHLHSPPCPLFSSAAYPVLTSPCPMKTYRLYCCRPNARRAHLRLPFAIASFPNRRSISYPIVSTPVVSRAASPLLRDHFVRRPIPCCRSNPVLSHQARCPRPRRTPVPLLRPFLLNCRHILDLPTAAAPFLSPH
jgi:hypothetical protein